jgi:hypothetical protein
MEVVKRLEDAGLIIRTSNRSGRFGIEKELSIIKPKPKSIDNSSDNRGGRYYGSERIPFTDVVTHLSLKNGKWFFVKSDWIPGPGRDDFYRAFSSLDEAAISVIAFYFGESTIIDGWVFPLHRHPELQISAVREVLPNAVQITPEAFSEIKKGYRKELVEFLKAGASEDWESDWQQIYSHQFLDIHHIEDDTIVLQLRRDMEEVYIISKT